MAIQTDFLKTIPYFTGLEDEELAAIAKFVTERKLERGSIIESEEEEARVVHFVGAGVVKVFKSSADGKEQILNLVRPGESFNDVPVFSGRNRTGAQAMSPVTLYDLQKADLNLILKKHPPVATNLIQVLSERVEQLMTLVEDLSFRPVVGRVARILLEQADGLNRNPRLTQQEMAAMAGTAREMVGRSLKALEEEGAIKLDRHLIIIKNKKELREIAR
ncbi:MAG: Crp/Fnr family transcriptional regulator [Chloroflexi bacterium]|nr:Crp/Fnr family transcriptional regulator [Chloroflexota bacterium]